MKSRSLLSSFIASLAMLGISSLTSPPSVTAEAAPIFRPLLQDISNALPKGMAMRLPSVIPTTGSSLYPRMLWNDDYLTITLYPDTRCIAYGCLAASFTVMSQDEQEKSIYDKFELSCMKSALVELKPGIAGIYFKNECQDFDMGNQHIYWKQEDQYFGAFLRLDLSRQEFIKIATSMANEPVIYDKFTQASHNMTSTPKVPTWQQFVDRGGGRYIQSDYDLPDEFRNGPVYFNQGANVIGAYILKEGLPSYPPATEGGLQQIDPEVGERYIRSGQAIGFSWNLSNSGLRFANETQVRFRGRGMGCLRTTCLTAPFLSNAEIGRILHSRRNIDDNPR